MQISHGLKNKQNLRDEMDDKHNIIIKLFIFVNQKDRFFVGITKRTLINNNNNNAMLVSVRDT